MANKIKLKRGLKSDLDSLILEQGELAITTDTNELVAAKSDGVLEILTPKIDNSTIVSNNLLNQIQTVGIVDDNSKSTLKAWTGTLEEYQAIETKDDNTLYYITNSEVKNSSAAQAYIWDGLSSADNPENINLFQQIFDAFLNGEGASVLILDSSLLSYDYHMYYPCNLIAYVPGMYEDGSGLFGISAEGITVNSVTDLDSRSFAGMAVFSQDFIITEVQAVDVVYDTITIPTKTSELTNDSDFTTKAYVDNKIQMALDGTTLNITLGE